MKFYLSSYKLGNHAEELVRMMEPEKKIGYVPNALDYTNVDIERRNKAIDSDISALATLGLDVQLLDLKDYFTQIDKLRERINKLGALFFCGGNTFILRQAMKASGFDIIFHELLNRDDFVYSGYSAGICVLGRDLKPLQQVDDPTEMPYEIVNSTIWEGLGYLDYMILPHYKSDHPESVLIDMELKYYQDNNIPFKTLRDGEVIIIE
ncbi:Type 1 glutamine amidotransferase-like domain-containing protein [Chloroflexota bacterium]